eukprot:gb/GECG01000193.1/.p1 GENE.gb/GECG01000193.1/~~gb/GECG01000193.1/.p1  ORF type:complete len:423 (+),score=35.47 gb/GECG01000193.1/:1-1269(+)
MESSKDQPCSEHVCSSSSTASSTQETHPSPTAPIKEDKRLRDRCVKLLDSAVKRGMAKLSPEIQQRCYAQPQRETCVKNLEEQVFSSAEYETNTRYRESIRSLVYNLSEGGTILEAAMMGFISSDLLACVSVGGEIAQLLSELQDARDAAFIPAYNQNSTFLQRLQPCFPLIFSFLHAKEFAKLQLVCRSFKRVAGSNLFWYAYCTRDFSKEKPVIGASNKMTEIQKKKWGRSSLLVENPSWGSFPCSEATILQTFLNNRLLFTQQTFPKQRRKVSQIAGDRVSKHYRRHSRRRRKRRRSTAEAGIHADTGDHNYNDNSSSNTPITGNGMEFTSAQLPVMRDEFGEPWKNVYLRLYIRASRLLAATRKPKVSCATCKSDSAEIRIYSRAMTFIKYAYCSLCYNVRVLECSHGDLADIVDALF